MSEWYRSRDLNKLELTLHYKIIKFINYNIIRFSNCKIISFDDLDHVIATDMISRIKFTWKILNYGYDHWDFDCRIINYKWGSLPSSKTREQFHIFTCTISTSPHFFLLFILNFLINSFFLNSQQNHKCKLFNFKLFNCRMLTISMFLLFFTYCDHDIYWDLNNPHIMISDDYPKVSDEHIIYTYFTFIIYSLVICYF